MRGRARAASIAVLLAGSMVVQAPGSTGELIPQYGRGIALPVGFVSRVFAQPPIVPTTLTWGPDVGGGLAALGAAADERHGALLYVGGVAGNPLSCADCGQVIAINDEGEMHTAAEGLQSILGVTFGPDGAMYVSDNNNSRGRVVQLRDTDGDGLYETQRVLLKNIPNGRHQTNGLSFGPDGELYVANGNATDNGLGCGPYFGPPDPVGLPEPLKSFYENTFRNDECADPEIVPWTGSILRVDTGWDGVDLMADIEVDGDPFYAEDGMDDESVLVARGFRNIYDVDFRPGHGGEIWTPMNGPDNPSGSEPVYGFEVDNEQIVGFDPETEEPIWGPIIEDAGFPSCLYDPHDNVFPRPDPGGHPHEGIPNPEPNTYPGIEETFGPCVPEDVMRVRTVLTEGHEGTSGLAFERGGNFPARYDGDLFIALWGSLWNLNGLRPTGHKILHLEINEDGTVGRQREFMTGVLPIDVTFSPDGLMYVADMSGQIHEVRFRPELETDESVGVSMADPGAFVPATQAVIRGQKVVWTNDSGSPHNVTFQRAVIARDAVYGEEQFLFLQASQLTDLNSPGDLQPGESYTLEFENAGTYQYVSTTGDDDPAMAGTIVVTTLER